MTDVERSKYLEAYYSNEADANKQMSLANVAAAIYMLAIWICYLTDFFKKHSITENIFTIPSNLSAFHPDVRRIHPCRSIGRNPYAAVLPWSRS